MNRSDAPSALAALGNEVRLDAYRLLVRAGPSGLAIGDLQKRLGSIPRSTLAHHLHKLLEADLVQQHKAGASVISQANYQRMDALVHYLTAECCADERPAIQELAHA